MSSAPETPPRVVDISAKLLEHAEMRELLTFNIEDGRIWMYDKRVTLQEVSVFGSLRAKLVHGIGLQAAREFMQRLGFQTGARDATLILQRYAPNSEQARMSLHGFQGICRVENIFTERDPVDGRTQRGEWIYHQCAEADAHIDAFGIGTDVACWMEVGYASGYMSTRFNFPFWVKEIACRAAGSQTCRVVGKRLTTKAEIDEFNSFFQDPFSGLIPPPAPPSAAKFSVGPSDGDVKERVIVGNSASLKEALHLLESVASTDATVLVTGESGVGKELFTRNLHAKSQRAGKPFVAVNCAAIPEGLVESELFGAERGAFTGAFQSRAGRFERAHGGTIFLDEVGSLNHVAQAKLLRVLQEGEYERVGGTKTVQTDARVIAATNVSLKEAVQNGTFREDLFFRLNVFPIHLPPLRERRDDIPALLSHYLAKFNSRHSKKVPGFTFDALQLLLNYRFPGNIRELENLVERAVILAKDVPINTTHLFVGGEVLTSSLWTLDRAGKIVRRVNSDLVAADIERTTNSVSSSLSIDFGRPVHWPEVERSLFEEIAQQALNHTNGNVSEAARLLGMERHQFAYRLKHQR